MFGHHSKTYYKYLASYGALLLTAIIALVFVSQVFFIRQLRTNLEDNHRALVQQSVQEMDSDLQQIYDIEYQISTVNQNFFLSRMTCSYLLLCFHQAPNDSG